MKRFLNIIFWIVISIALFITASNFYTNYKAKAEIESKLQEAQKAYDFVLKDIEGNSVKLSDYRGKIVFLNFWATWCPPCRKEIPDLIKASEELSKGNDAVILAINITNGYNGETADRVKSFVKDNKMTMKVLLDDKGYISDKYSIESIPTTFIIDKEGNVYDYKVSTMSYNEIMDIIKELK